MTGNQRWLERKAIFRRPDEQIDVRRYEVTEISKLTAKAFVEAHHYSGSYPAGRFMFGLHRAGDLVGVAVFSHPARDEVIFNTFPMAARNTDAVELGRLVLLDDVEGNGETWFLGRTFEALRGRVIGVLSHSDPQPRETLDGRRVLPGHWGTIYQAHNGRYLGRTKPRTARLLPDGTILNERSLAKVVANVRGGRPVVEALVGWGADPLPDIAPRDVRKEWVSRWVATLTRPLRHRGCHRYAWTLDKKIRREANAHWDLRWGALAYPKSIDQPLAA